MADELAEDDGGRCAVDRDGLVDVWAVRRPEQKPGVRLPAVHSNDSGVAGGPGGDLTVVEPTRRLAFCDRPAVRIGRRVGRSGRAGVPTAGIARAHDIDPLHAMARSYERHAVERCKPDSASTSA